MTLNIAADLQHIDTGTRVVERSAFAVMSLTLATYVSSKLFYPTTSGTLIHDASIGETGNTIDCLAVINESLQSVRLEWVEEDVSGITITLDIPAGSMLLVTSVKFTEDVTLKAADSDYPRCRILIGSH